MPGNLGFKKIGCLKEEHFAYRTHAMLASYKRLQNHPDRAYVDTKLAVHPKRQFSWDL